jgi:hypothetical protein
LLNVFLLHALMPVAYILIFIHFIAATVLFWLHIDSRCDKKNYLIRLNYMISHTVITPAW